MEVILFPHNKSLVKNKEYVYTYNTDKDEFSKQRVIDIVTAILKQFRYNNIKIQCFSDDGREFYMLLDMDKIRESRYSCRIDGSNLIMFGYYVGCDISIRSNGRKVSIDLFNPDVRYLVSNNMPSNFRVYYAGKYGDVVSFKDKVLLISSADIGTKFDRLSWTMSYIYFSYDGRVLRINVRFSSNNDTYVISSEFKADAPSIVLKNNSKRPVVRDIQPILRKIPQELKRKYILTGSYT